MAQTCTGSTGSVHSANEAGSVAYLTADSLLMLKFGCKHKMAQAPRRSGSIHSANEAGSVAYLSADSASDVILVAHRQLDALLRFSFCDVHITLPCEMQLSVGHVAPMATPVAGFAAPVSLLARCGFEPLLLSCLEQAHALVVVCSTRSLGLRVRDRQLRVRDRLERVRG